jgi:hypothetical protein
MTFLRLIITGAPFAFALISTTYFHPKTGIAAFPLSKC